MSPWKSQTFPVPGLPPSSQLSIHPGGKVAATVIVSVGLAVGEKIGVFVFVAVAVPATMVDVAVLAGPRSPAVSGMSCFLLQPIITRTRTARRAVNIARTFFIISLHLQKIFIYYSPFFY